MLLTAFDFVLCLPTAEKQKRDSDIAVVRTPFCPPALSRTSANEVRADDSSFLTLRHRSLL